MQSPEQLSKIREGKKLQKDQGEVLGSQNWNRNPNDRQLAVFPNESRREGIRTQQGNRGTYRTQNWDDSIDTQMHSKCQPGPRLERTPTGGKGKEGHPSTQCWVPPIPAARWAMVSMDVHQLCRGIVL